MTTQTAELDMKTLAAMNKITRAVIDGHKTNAQAADELRKLREQLHEALFKARN